MEEFDKFGPSISQVAMVELLGIGKKLSWTRAERHRRMGYRPLQSEHCRSDLRCYWESRSHLLGLETEVFLEILAGCLTNFSFAVLTVISVRFLRLSTGAYHVGLSCYLITWA